MAFSNTEMQRIRKSLLQEARHCAIAVGMRKTSVEQLTEAAGISKGSFYKFFDSKEMVFFEVLTELHEEIYRAAQRALKECSGLAPSERFARAMLTACERLSDMGIMDFVQNDAEYLLRRIPEKIREKYYQEDRNNIRRLFEESGVCPKGGIDVAAAVIRGLTLTVAHRKQLGECYPKALKTIVYGTCRELVLEG